MTRLIDTLDADELDRFMYDTFGVLYDGIDIRQELENLFKPVPHWSDNLNAEDKQTWVLCCLSDESPELTGTVDWVTQCNSREYVTIQYDSWKYATPVDLNLRYYNGEE